MEIIPFQEKFLTHTEVVILMIMDEHEVNECDFTPLCLRIKCTNKQIKLEAEQLRTKTQDH